MKLNLDCIREVLLFLETQDCVEVNEDGTFSWAWTDLETVCDALSHYNPEDVFYTLFQLSEANFIDSTIQYGDDSVQLFHINHITIHGHQYLEAIRDAQRWGAIKTIAGKIGSFSLDMISAVAEGLGKAALDKLDLTHYLPI